MVAPITAISSILWAAKKSDASSYPYDSELPRVVLDPHDANAAAAADRVLFLNDGKIVHDMSEPTAERILDMMKSIGS